MAQSVERVLGKDEVTSSNLVSSSKSSGNEGFPELFVLLSIPTAEWERNAAAQKTPSGESSEAAKQFANRQTAAVHPKAYFKVRIRHAVNSMRILLVGRPRILGQNGQQSFPLGGRDLVQ